MHTTAGLQRPARHQCKKEKIKTKVKISYHGSNTNWFNIKVLPKAFIDLLKIFLKDVKVENDV